MNRHMAWMLAGLCMISGCGSDTQPTSQQAVNPNQTAEISEQKTVKASETTSKDAVQAGRFFTIRGRESC